MAEIMPAQKGSGGAGETEPHAFGVERGRRAGGDGERLES